MGTFKKYDSSKTVQLAELRDFVGFGQDEAAAYFGLTSEDRRSAIGKWERGEGRPAKTRRHQFIYYLWDKLRLKEDPRLFLEIWNEIVVGQWEYLALSNEELPVGFPPDLIDKSKVFKPFNVKSRLPYFVGRTKELHTLKTNLTSGGEKFVCVVGLGGVGKTVLVTELAYELEDYFTDGVLFTRLKQNTNGTLETLAFFAEAYGSNVHKYHDLDVRSQKVRQILSSKHALIILDNAESSEEIEPLLPPSGTCTVIITTRHKKLSATRGAFLLELPLFDKTGNDTIALFTKLLNRPPSKQEHQDLLEIASLSGHLPLALAIAISHIAYDPGQSTAEYLELLLNEDERLNELQYEKEGVRLNFNISYRKLNPHDRDFFASLGVFSGREFDIVAAAAIVGVSPIDARRIIRELYNLSLLQEVDNNRYNLHTLLSLYAREKIETETRKSVDVIERKLADYFINFAVKHKTESKLLHLEMENILAALELANFHGMQQEFVNGVNAVSEFLLSQGKKDRLYEHLSLAEQAAKEIEDEVGFAEILNNRGDVDFDKADYGQAEISYSMALEIARKHDLIELESEALSNLGACKGEMGKYEIASQYLDRALVLAQRAKVPKLIIKALGNIARIKVGRASYEEIIKSYEQILDESRKIDHETYIYNTLIILGALSMNAGRFSRALSYLSEVKDYANRLEKDAMLLAVLINEGGVFLASGQYKEANRIFNESLSLAREIKSKDHECGSLNNLGLAAIKQNDLESAQKYLNAAIKLAETVEDPSFLIEAEVVFAELWLAQENFDTARSLCMSAKTLAIQIGGVEYQADALFALARIQAQTNDNSSARKFALESLDIFTKLGHYKALEVKEWLESWTDFNFS